MNQKICLVAFDTDHVKEYIFATPDLKKIRGGSALLENLNQEQTLVCLREIYPTFPDEHFVKGGGMALALLPTPELAQHAIDAVEKLYREKTMTATVTGAYVIMPEDELNTEEFAKWYRRAGAHLRRAKDEKGLEPTVPLQSYLRSCSSCGRHPAQYLDPNEEGQALCASCYLKLQTHQDKGRDLFRRDFEQFISNAWGKFDFPQDMNDLGGLSSPGGYVGFILADGNNVGEYLLEVAKSGFSRFREFSQELDRCVREITHAALEDALCPRRGLAPFEILLVGGDDLMLITTANKALEVAANITEAFAARTTKLARDAGRKDTLSLSAGVVLAHANFPMNAMHNLARELLQSAKRASSEQQDRPGMIDFIVITESATAGLKSLRSGVLTERSFAISPPQGEKFKLTERPYTVARLRKLLDYTDKFRRHVPRSGLQRMYEALFISKVQAQLAALTTVARANSDARDLWLKFIEEMLEEDMADVHFPWRTLPNAPQRFSTPLGDLVEILPFVRRS